MRTKKEILEAATVINSISDIIGRFADAAIKRHFKIHTAFKDDAVYVQIFFQKEPTDFKYTEDGKTNSTFVAAEIHGIKYDNFEDICNAIEPHIEPLIEQLLSKLTLHTP